MDDSGVLILGGGHGGAAVAAQLRQLSFRASVTLLADEPHYPYQRPPLSKDAGSTHIPQYIYPAQFYRDNNIDVRLASRAEQIDVVAKQVHTSGGARYRYGSLVIATGAAPRSLDVPGGTLKGIQALRTTEDRQSLSAAMACRGQLMVVGGGFVGLEIAALATELGCTVTVVEAGDHILSRVASPELATYLTQTHTASGVTIHCSRQVVGFLGEETVTGARLSDGSVVACDHVLVGIGATPRDGLAERAGIACDGGIIVDGACRTSATDVFAVGDCSNRHHDRLGGLRRLESIPSASEQAKIVAQTIVGNHRSAHGVPWFWSDQMNTKVKNVGVYSPGLDTVVVDPETCRDGERAYFHLDRAGSVIAVETVNSPRLFALGKRITERGGAVDRMAIEKVATNNFRL